jgi:hypothetical protein
MSRVKWAFVPGVAALLALAILGSFVALTSAAGGRSTGTAPRIAHPAGASPAPTQGCGPAWRVVGSPNSGSVDNDIYGVAALSATDIWAVGSAVSQTLTMHWDGVQWSVVPSPSQGTLYGVAAISSANVWAAGYIGTFPGPYQSVIEHWDGTQWSVVPSPNPQLGAQLLSISGVSAGDIWAVGQFYVNNVHQTLTIHWDGTQWSVVPSPNAAPNSELAGVAALSTGNVWAVGGYINSLRRYVPMIEHWDGTQWSIVSSPDLQGYLFSVSGSAAGDVWAAGYLNNGAIHTLIEHWDGSQWAQIDSPNPGPVENFAYGVAALSTMDAWAVGSGNGTLAMHWDGAQWSVVPSPNVNGGGSFSAVAALSPTNIWAVGDYYDNSVYRTLAEQYSSPACATVTPTATNTAPATNTGTPTGTTTQTATPTATGITVPSATRTPIPVSTGTATGTTTQVATPTASNTVVSSATRTSTATTTQAATATGSPTTTAVTATGTTTPTPCAIGFSDVQPSDFFYEPVRYLYCHGAISGYADGTFKPYNNTTRGQLSKIVVLAQGWTIYTPPSPTFQDVPFSHTFYQYVETAYSHAIISGYNCGAGCLEFRPGNNVTRGQLCKIVVRAQGWTIYTPPAPTFNDVPSTDAFFGYVETAYSHSIISGYSCGAGCLEFRPGNNATRGQICKIVYNAVRQDRN